MDSKEIQKELLKIVKDFDAFCTKYDLTYFLMGGSALGAMRHRGFIPWDDDIDVFMPYHDYHKFKQLFSLLTIVRCTIVYNYQSLFN